MQQNTRHPRSGQSSPASAPQFRRPTAIEWRASHTVQSLNRKTSVERILVRGRSLRSVHLVLVDNSVSLMSLVACLVHILPSPHAITHNFKKIYP
jgi:hypothetical protein